ncbi:MAG: hypothetical protein ACF8OB_02930 [Phycisphaeraceae bacterium JB051]
MTNLPLGVSGFPVLHPDGVPALDCGCCKGAYKYTRCGDASIAIHIHEDIATHSQYVFQGKCWNRTNTLIKPKPDDTITDGSVLTPSGSFGGLSAYCCMCEECDGNAYGDLIVQLSFAGFALFPTDECIECPMSDGRGWGKLLWGGQPNINGLSLTATRLACSSHTYLWENALGDHTGRFKEYWTSLVEAYGSCAEEAAHMEYTINAVRNVSLSLNLVMSQGYGIAVVSADPRIWAHPRNENNQTEPSVFNIEPLCSGGVVTTTIPNYLQSCGNRFAWGGSCTLTLQLDEGI